MSRMGALYRWALAIFCCAAVIGLPYIVQAAGTRQATPSQVKIMVIIQGPGQQRSQTAENALAQVFLNQGYKVLDSATVAQTLRRNADLLRRPEVQRSQIEAAKRLGSRASADIVVSGEAKSHVADKTYTLLEGKKVPVSQADISVRMVLVGTGTQIMTAKDTKRKPFDTTGEVAIQMAAESIAGRLLQGLEEFLNRDLTDYRLVVLDVNDSQSIAFQESLRNRMQGVRQVDEHRSKQNVSELNVRVEKDQDLPFKQNLFSQLFTLGLGTFEVVAGEGGTFYLRKAGGSMPPQQDEGIRQPPLGVPHGGVSPTVPSLGASRYRIGYGKSWAVLIGINEYQHWPKLRYAVNDARSIENLVRELGFNEVIMVLDGDATQQRILRVLGDELYANTQDEDRVFIFFAGHGQTQDLPTGEKEGYIIPVDGDLNNYYSTAISMQQLQGLSDRIRAKHMFYAMDTCFSGLLLRLRGEALSVPPIELTTALARQVLTAGREGEKVFETGGHGLFTKSLLSGLAGAADLNKDGHITASELYQYISPQVLAESRNTQNPVFGRLGYGQGEFVFMRQ